MGKNWGCDKKQEPVTDTCWEMVLEENKKVMSRIVWGLPGHGNIQNIGKRKEASE